jgi:hypothetical protein
LNEEIGCPIPPQDQELCPDKETISGIFEEFEIDKRTWLAGRETLLDEKVSDYQQRDTDKGSYSQGPGKVDVGILEEVVDNDGPCC